MALTKLQALDKFCTYFEYEKMKFPGETKGEFLKRKQKEWAIGIVQRQVADEQRQAAANDIAGIDI